MASTETRRGQAKTIRCVVAAAATLQSCTTDAAEALENMGGARRFLIARLNNTHDFRSGDELSEARDALRVDFRTGAIEEKFAVDSHAVADLNAAFYDSITAAEEDEELSQLLKQLHAQKCSAETEGTIQKKA